MSTSNFADKLRRRYERELKNLRSLPDPIRQDYLTYSAYCRAISGRAQSIKNREQWIFNLRYYGLKDLPFGTSPLKLIST